MSNSATIAVRVNPQVKESATRVVEGLGLDLSTALRLFVNQIALKHRIPLDLSYDDSYYDLRDEVKGGIAEARAGKGLSKAYDSLDEFWEDLLA